MLLTVRKWGNSLAIRIPKSFAKEVGLDSESEVNLVLEDGRLVIEPVNSKDQSLEKFLSMVTEENLHSEIEFGALEGREIW